MKKIRNPYQKHCLCCEYFNHWSLTFNSKDNHLSRVNGTRGQNFKKKNCSIRRYAHWTLSWPVYHCLAILAMRVAITAITPFNSIDRNMRTTLHNATIAPHSNDNIQKNSQFIWHVPPINIFINYWVLLIYPHSSHWVYNIYALTLAL